MGIYILVYILYTYNPEITDKIGSVDIVVNRLSGQSNKQ